MPDQAGGDEQERQGKPESPALRSSGGPNAAAESKKDQRAARKEERQRARVTRGWSLFFQGAVAVATLVYVVSSYLLWLETREAVGLTRRSVEVTEKALAATEESNRLTAEALAATEESNKLTRQGIETSRSLGEESNRLTSEAVSVARDNLAFSQEAYRSATRPWLIVETVEVSLAAGERVEARFWLLNAGEVPAYFLSMRAFLFTSQRPEQGNRPTPQLVNAIMAPGQRKVNTIPFPLVMDQGQLDRIKSGEKSLFLESVFTYEDHRGRAFQGASCHSYAGRRGTWGGCADDKLPVQERQE